MGFFKEIGKHIFGISCSACENKWASLEELKGTPTQDDWMRLMLEDLSGNRGFVCTSCQQLLCEGCWLRSYKKCPHCRKTSFRYVWLIDQASSNRP
jgi:hypothetical protein